MKSKLKIIFIICLQLMLFHLKINGAPVVNDIMAYNNKATQIINLVRNNNSISSMELKTLHDLGVALNKSLYILNKKIESVKDSLIQVTPSATQTYDAFVVGYHNSTSSRASFELGVTAWKLDASIAAFADTVDLLFDNVIMAANELNGSIQLLDDLTQNFHLPYNLLLTELNYEEEVAKESLSSIIITYENIGTESVDSSYIKLIIDNPYFSSLDSLFIGSVTPNSTGQVTFHINAPNIDTFAGLSIELKGKYIKGDVEFRSIKSIELCQNTYYFDNDVDGFGNPSISIVSCIQPEGYVIDNTDCNDSNHNGSPVSNELCNGLDDNCNGQIDEGVLITFYLDDDGDGYGNPSTSVQGCSAPEGFVKNNTDCDDTNASINPGSTELCNTLDDNCNSQIDESVKTNFFQDFDGDGYGNPLISLQGCITPEGYVANNFDCNDQRADIRPGMPELCNGFDDDCNGHIDSGCGTETYFEDSDNDSFGNPNKSITTNAITPPSGYVANSNDCDDTNAEVRPGGIEICNEIDDNCNGQIDEGVLITFFLDEDGDGFGTSTSSVQACIQPLGYVSNSLDCNDNNTLLNPAQVEIPCNGLDDNCNGQIDEGPKLIFFRDADGDGFGNLDNTTEACSSPVGYVSNSLDCNDNNTLIHPGGIESCNGLDDNCDGIVDEGLLITFFRDSDGDGFGNPNNTTQACSVPNGFVTNNTDCNDTNANIHPGSIELCNGVDDDCNGGIDEGVNITFFRDADSDGFGDADITTQDCSAPTGFVTNSSDCNDSNASIHPGATESCNGFDDDCNGTIDEGVKITFFQDTDNDGFGNPSSTVQACTQPMGYVSNNMDCNDSKASVNPNATETCDGLDNNCNGTIDENVKLRFYRDMDGDGFGNPNRFLLACIAPTGYVTDNTDCNDGRKLSNPNAPELCNGIDDNCNGIIDENAKSLFYQDADGDGFGNPNSTNLSCSAPAGYVANNADCNDNVSAIFPGAEEVCNDVDDDCDGLIDEGCPAVFIFFNDLDADGFGNPLVFITRSDQIAPEGYVANNSDCDDNNVNIHPQAFEICNDIDDNCNGETDEGLSPLYPSVITGQFLNVCKNSTKIYSVTNQVGVVFNWTPPANARIINGQGTNTVTVSFSNSFVSGTLSVTATNCTTSGARKLNIYSLPAAPTQIDGLNSVCINSIHNYSCSIIPDAISYNWNAPLGSSIISGQGSNDITVQFGGSVSTGHLSVQSVNSCGNSITRSYQVDVVNCNNSGSQNRSYAGINQDNKDNLEVYIYPNPTNGLFTLDINQESKQKIVLEVYDLMGRKIEFKEFNDANIFYTFGDNYQAGVFIAKIQIGDEVTTRKIIKQD